MKNRNQHQRPKTKGSSLVELIIVTILFMILVPASLNIFVGARKITGQSYIQNQAAVTLGEANDIIRYMRNLDYDLIPLGEFFLIRNPGTGAWLVKSDLPDRDIFERKITVTDALRHTVSGDVYMDGDTGANYVDTDTKKVEISILWAPDYLPLDLVSHTLYITNWQKPVTYL